MSASELISTACTIFKQRWPRSKGYPVWAQLLRSIVNKQSIEGQVPTDDTSTGLVPYPVRTEDLTMVVNAFENIRQGTMRLFVTDVFECALREIRSEDDLPLIDEVDVLLEEGIVQNLRLQRLAELHHERGDLDCEPPELRDSIRQPRRRPLAGSSNAALAGAAVEPVASTPAQGDEDPEQTEGEEEAEAQAASAAQLASAPVQGQKRGRGRPRGSTSKRSRGIVFSIRERSGSCALDGSDDEAEHVFEDNTQEPPSNEAELIDSDGDIEMAFGYGTDVGYPVDQRAQRPIEQFFAVKDEGFSVTHEVEQARPTASGSMKLEDDSTSAAEPSGEENPLGPFLDELMKTEPANSESTLPDEPQAAHGDTDAQPPIQSSDAQTSDTLLEIKRWVDERLAEIIAGVY